MNEYFEMSQLMKRKFEKSLISNFLSRRILDSINGKNLENLVIKSTNTNVFRVGFLESVPMVLRIPKGWNRDYSQMEVETFCVNSQRVSRDLDVGSSSFCLPIRYLGENDEGEQEEYYALLVEDLTDWRRHEFFKNGSGDSKKILSLKDGGEREVFVDLGPRSSIIYSPDNLDFIYTNNALDLIDFQKKNY